MTDKAQRYIYIDAIRGIAALAVVYFHSAWMFLENGVPIATGEWLIFYTATNVLDLGKIAVVVFFAISGYVIPFSLMRQGEGVKTGFVIGRIFRLYPAYWLSMAAASVVLFQLLGLPLATRTVLANATMLQKAFGQPDMIGVYWTLQIEILFYLLCFGLHVCGWLSKPRIVFAAAIMFVGLALLVAGGRYATGRALPVAIPLSLAIMLFGMLWRLWHMHRTPQSRAYVRWLLIVLVAAVPPISVLAYTVDQGHHETWYRYVLTYYAALVLFCVFTSKIRAQSRILSYLGAISYSVYLFGPIVEGAAEQALPGLLGGRYPAHLFVAIVIAGTIIVAMLVHHGVEKPSIRLGKWLSQRVTHRAQPASATAFEVAL